MTPHLWILDGHEPVPVRDLLVWGEWMRTADRHVARDVIDGMGITVSTVFLGLDHRFGVGRPVLFETMVFTSDETPLALSHVDGEQRRYSTWDDAAAGHQAMLATIADACVAMGDEQR